MTYSIKSYIGHISSNSDYHTYSDLTFLDIQKYFLPALTSESEISDLIGKTITDPLNSKSHFIIT